MDKEELDLIPDGFSVVPPCGIGWYPALRLWSGFDETESIEDAFLWNGNYWVDDFNHSMSFWPIRFDTKKEALDWIDSLHEF
jgi:hypothetical protein